MNWTAIFLLTLLLPQTESIERARRVAQDYTHHLPNFIAVADYRLNIGRDWT